MSELLPLLLPLLQLLFLMLSLPLLLPLPLQLSLLPPLFLFLSLPLFLPLPSLSLRLAFFVCHALSFCLSLSLSGSRVARWKLLCLFLFLSLSLCLSLLRPDLTRGDWLSSGVWLSSVLCNDGSQIGDQGGKDCPAGSRGSESRTWVVKLCVVDPLCQSCYDTENQFRR
jgi:hypothetical protein